MALNDKIRGMLWGVVLGDVLGAPFESYQHGLPLSEYSGRLDDKPEEKRRHKVTDDTQMTLILARSLIANNGFDKDEIIKAYQYWANTQKPLYAGRNLRALFKGVHTLAGYRSRATKTFGSQDKAGLYPASSQSNGALMRVSSAVCFGLGAAISDTMLTNPNIICITATKVYIRLLKALLLKKDIPTKVRRLIKRYGEIIAITEALSDALDENKHREGVDSRDKGWVAHALYVAVYCLLWTNSFTEGINTAILFGGDTDTNGAIAGALLGAKYGYSAIVADKTQKRNVRIIKVANAEELDDLEDIISSLVEQFEQPWDEI